MRFWKIVVIALLTPGLVTAAEPPDGFKTYDMTGLSWMPPALVEKGFEKLPVLFMCHMWNGDYGTVNTNCDDVDFSTVNHDVVRQRAREMLGVPLVVIDIERTKNPTSYDWNLHSEDLEQVARAVKLWQEMIATFREVNTESEIMIYKPIPRIWWPLVKNRKMPLLNRGQATIDARYEIAKTVAPLFEDKSLWAWPSAYLTRRDPEIFREDWRWQLKICKELYQTRCVFALTPFYQQRKGENRQAVSQDRMLEVIRQLEEDGADGVGMWLPFRYDNLNYRKRMQDWAENGGYAAEQQDPQVAWLGAIERYLDGEYPAAETPAE